MLALAPATVATLVSSLLAFPHGFLPPCLDVLIASGRFLAVLNLVKLCTLCQASNNYYWHHRGDGSVPQRMAA